MSIIGRRVVLNPIPRATRGIAELRADELTIDPRVQRDPPPRTVVDKLAGAWNRDATGVLVVSRRIDGTNVLIDGQTRRVAALRVDPTFRFIAEVHTDLTLQQEIELFEHHNKHRRTVSAVDLLRLRMEHGREPYATARIHLARRGLRVANAARTGAVDVLSAAGPVEWTLRQPRGAVLLGVALDVVMTAFPSEETRWRGVFLQGVCAVVVAADRGPARLDQARLARTLQDYLPRHWEQRARELAAAYAGGNATGLGTTVAREMIRRYNKRLVERNRLPDIPAPQRRGGPPARPIGRGTPIDLTADVADSTVEGIE